MKRVWKPHRDTHHGPIPDTEVLLTAVARELLTTWEVTKDRQLVARHLAAVDKTYCAGSEVKVRTLMHQVKQDERCGND